MGLYFLELQEVLDPPAIVPSSQYQLSLAFPDLGQHKVQDLFSSLGPVAIFSAKHHWTAPRNVRLKKREHEGYGFSVRGDAPVIIAGVDHGSIAEVRTGCDQMRFGFAVHSSSRYWATNVIWYSCPSQFPELLITEFLNFRLNFANFWWHSLLLLFNRLIPEFPNSRHFSAETN